MNRPERIESKIQLLVEGNDQRNFFNAFIGHLAIEEIQIQNFGGVPELKRFLRAFVNVPGFQDTVERIGIVRDAEKSAGSAFQSVQSSLKRAGLPVPDHPESPSDSCPSVSVFILPGRGEPGMLENLLCETFAGSPEDDCIRGFFDCLADSGVGEIRRPHKARAWAYLTTKPDPHHSVGYATTKGYWGDLDQQVFSVVRDFLTSLIQGETRDKGR